MLSIYILDMVELMMLKLCSVLMRCLLYWFVNLKQKLDQVERIKGKYKQKYFKNSEHHCSAIALAKSVRQKTTKTYSLWYYVKYDLKLLFFCIYSIGQLADLENLDLSHNKLESLPECISELKSIRKLDISRCCLAALPER